MSKILIFGDVYGKLGRYGLAQVLPMLKAEHQPDVIVANVENLTHGKGVHENTLAELDALGVDVYTSGNHVFHNMAAAQRCFGAKANLIRPENYGSEYPGRGAYRFEKNGQGYLVCNLNGQTFFEKQFRGPISSPFTAIDQLLIKHAHAGDIIVVDVHAEATSEKLALGWHLDGRVSCVYGTHTHVPTADAWVMPGGTAFVCDVGMTGPIHSVIGVKTENVLGRFLDPSGHYPMEPAESGPVAVRVLLLNAQGGRAVSIQRLDTIIET